MIYLKIQAMTGNVTAKNYQGCIEVYNYSFSSERAINSKPGLVSNRSAGLIQYSSLMLTKPMDKATSALLKYYYDAKVIPEINFHHVTTGSDPQCYFTNTFKEVLIKTHAMSCDANHVCESLSLCFSANQKRIIPLDEKNKLGTPESVGYNWATAQAL